MTPVYDMSRRYYYQVDQTGQCVKWTILPDISKVNIKMIHLLKGDIYTSHSLCKEHSNEVISYDRDDDIQYKRLLLLIANDTSEIKCHSAHVFSHLMYPHSKMKMSHYYLISSDSPFKQLLS